MPLLKIEPDEETYRRLKDRADAERRPLPWQVEVELRRAVGLPFPVPSGGEDDPPATEAR